MSDNSNNSTRTLSSTQTKADGDENTEKQHVGREFRWHALLDQWVIVAASTSDRPWNGNRATTVQTTSVRHDPDCYLCPNVTRSSGTENPAYQGTYAFDNDYPSLIGSVEMGRDKPSQENFAYDATSASNKLHHSLPSTGACRVLCWNDRHDLTLATLNSDDMLSVARLWRDEFTMLKKRQDIAQVLIFENKGLETGVSNLHPHGQIYATPFVSDLAIRMRKAQANYAYKHQAPLLQQLLQRPEYNKDTTHSLLVEDGEWFKTIVPYFARFPYETWIVPKQHACFIDALNDEQLEELAMQYQRQARRYDALFRRSSPYITLLHNAPCDNHSDNQWCCFHIVMQPPLREPDKLKFLAGFESGAGNIVNPLVPEMAAKQLRECTTQIKDND